MLLFLIHSLGDSDPASKNISITIDIKQIGGLIDIELLDQINELILVSIT
ncbi:hypothetical protein GH810_06380 [Acetobacterium paludosum]|uniref:RadC-like JAB domain-containing protein n=1 Tax=Acetobacterium paludosum TaxID=52693 RepID=A0A923HWK0_9FIRM|nr:hypothetical protein [Acetobacterium paludosum]